jgi:hypothetical protein
MISKREIFFFIALFAAGIIGAWKFVDHLKAKNNTPEKVAQRIINQSLQEDLCDRIESDLKKFKTSPASFQRTSLSTIELEAKQTLRKMLISRDVPEDFPIEYVGDGTSYSTCLSSAKAWLNIPSAGSQNLEDELYSLGVNKTTSSNKKIEIASVTSFNLNKRIALVIGNSEYKNRPLKNPKADAEDMRDFLREANFDVIFLENASLAEMQDAISKFNEKLKLSDVGFIYYSGHGIEHKGRNYLLPVNFNITDEDQIPRQSLDISEVVDKVSKAERKVNIFIIDACRSSFVATKSRSLKQGLQKMDGVKGTILAFSTSPGNLAEDGNGRNSPYTKHLLKSMSVPGRKIEDVFKETARNVEVETVGRQIPWFNSSLLVDFSIK